MDWSESYLLGIPAIDAQHKRLFGLLTEFAKALHAGMRGKDLEKVLDALDQYKTRHFQLEEIYMKECDYPGLEEQQKEHLYFDRRFSQLHDQLTESGLSRQIVNDIKAELSEWIHTHITVLDARFGEYYRKYKKNK